MLVVAGLVTLILATGGAPPRVWGVVAASIVVVAGAFLAAMQNRGLLATQIVIYGVTADALLLLLLLHDPRYTSVAVEALYVVALLSAFLTAPKSNLVFGVVTAIGMAVTTALRAAESHNPMVTAGLGITDIVQFALVITAATLVNRHMRESQDLLQARLDDIDEVVEHADRIATGDLSGEVPDDDDRLSEVVRDMLAGLRGIVSDMQEGVGVLATASSQIGTLFAEQERGAVNQASAVAETRQTVDGLASSASRIKEAASDVLDNAESTLTTSEQAAGRIAALVQHTDRINELLEVIKDVANKSQILALNAALEGTRSGEAGKGFSLVASQMRRLSESTMATVKDVKSLTNDIREATQLTTLAVEQTTKLAASTTHAAREIALITQQQSSSTEQVLEAMSDIAAVTDEFRGATQEALDAVEGLRELSAKMHETAHKFVL